MAGFNAFMGTDDIIADKGLKGIGDHRPGRGYKTVDDHRLPMGGGTDDETGKRTDFKAADLGKNV